jgi:dTMP kinase
MLMTEPRFVVFEGCDGSGKSTQARLLAKRVDAVMTREPGGTPAGLRMRALLLDHSPEGASLNIRTEALLMAADRAQNMAEVVLPALEAKRHAVSDRSYGSSLAYQGYGRGLGVADVLSISTWAMQERLPDVNVLLRVSLATVLDRMARTRTPDRLESEGPGFLQRVVDGFDALAAADPGRWRVVDGTGTIQEVAGRVWSAVEDLFG